MRFALTDPACVLEKNGNYHTISTHLSGCGNDIFIDSSTLTIVNQITNIMGFGTSPIKLTSRVGCLFHQQEISIGAILKEHIPPEIVPGVGEEITTTTELFTTSTTAGFSSSTTASSTLTSTASYQVTLKERSGTGDDDEESTTSKSTETTTTGSGLIDPRRGNFTRRPEVDDDDDDGDAKPKKEKETEKEETEKKEPTQTTPDSSTDEYEETTTTFAFTTTQGTTVSEIQTEIYATGTVPLTVDVDILTTVNVDIISTTAQTTEEPDETGKPLFPGLIDQRGGGQELPMPEKPCKGRKCKNKTRPTKKPRKTRPTKAPKTTKSPAPTEKTDPILIPTQTPEVVVVEDDIVPCNDGEKFKDHKCVNSSYDMPWRSQAEGKGLFFAKMFLYPDAEYDEPFVHPPVLASNETVFIGVQLMGGPPATTLSVKSCWASNMYHSPLELSSTKKADEITLDLIKNSCASPYPEGLVSIITNGEDNIAKFTSGVFKFVDYDTAYLYCRIRICPTGPCPTDCSSSERERRDSDEPVFEALVQSSDPYKIDSGPLLGATIYREPNRESEVEVVEIEVLDGKPEAEIEDRFAFGNILRDATLKQGTAFKCIEVQFEK
ncbi:Oidioi.mRNA.OKI2018_I69.chr1.g3278.t1.cds [Oikopleura dioica]|uniref:Oidioi.mRNA.OKI2018_I69.chr1.g3278.t1.cds n=1 Tax=Oikopleura dioica TaxID=34765 RepID=A0ABN7SZ26_OIKDI|nr:Oidioi.mRNA.OKI2018_I69.chr1.g3278.t1.cds [Oikopleura dioica]